MLMSGISTYICFEFMHGKCRCITMNIPYIASRGNGYPDEVETRVTHFYYMIRDYSGASSHFLTLRGTNISHRKSRLNKMIFRTSLQGGICFLVHWRGTRHGDSALLIHSPKNFPFFRHPQCYPISSTTGGFPEATPPPKKVPSRMIQDPPPWHIELSDSNN